MSSSWERRSWISASRLRSRAWASPSSKRRPRICSMSRAASGVASCGACGTSAGEAGCGPDALHPGLVGTHAESAEQRLETLGFVPGQLRELHTEAGDESLRDGLFGRDRPDHPSADVKRAPRAGPDQIDLDPGAARKKLIGAEEQSASGQVLYLAREGTVSGPHVRDDAARLYARMT